MAGPSGATARLALPYPVASDSADVPRDVKALADKLDATKSLGVPLVAALPVSPADGDEIYFQSAAMATAGIVWHLRYRAAIADAYKWELLGGGPFQNEIGTMENVGTAGSWANLATNGPQITCPLAGIYTINYGSRIVLSSRGITVWTGVAIGDTTPVGVTGAVELVSPDTGVPYTGPIAASVATRTRLTVAAGNIIKHRYLSGLATSGAQFGDRWLDVTPMRVG